MTKKKKERKDKRPLLSEGNPVTLACIPGGLRQLKNGTWKLTLELPELNPETISRISGKTNEFCLVEIDKTLENPTPLNFDDDE